MDQYHSLVKIEVQDFKSSYCKTENLQYQDIAKILKNNENCSQISNKVSLEMDITSTNHRMDCIEYFECHRCRKLCISKKDLIEHFKCHDLEIHKCTQCERGFTSKNSLSYHIKSHAGIKHECDICNRKFNDKSNMKKHRNIHLNIKNYKCTSCPKTYSDPTNFRSHLQQHAGVRFKCDICNKSLASKMGLKRHIKMTHFKIKSLDCALCFKAFYTRARLREHHNKEHFDIKYECDICQKIFFAKKKLTVHIKAHDEMPIKCTVCDKSFSGDHARSSYNEHKSTHSDFVICPYCSKQLRGSRKNLREHIDNVHTRSNDCSVCGKSYGQKCMKKHKMIHARPKPDGCFQKKKPSLHGELKEKKFQCHTCGMKYGSKGILADHIETIHLLTKHICEICEHVSSSSHSMSKHRREHPIVKYLCKHCLGKFNDHLTFKTHLKEHSINISSRQDNHSWKEHVKNFIKREKYKCNVCDKAVSTLTKMKHHMNEHLRINYHCQHCERQFTSTAALQRHLKVHDEYECPSCKKRFLKLYLLKSHLQNTKCFNAL